MWWPHAEATHNHPEGICQSGRDTATPRRGCQLYDRKWVSFCSSFFLLQLHAVNFSQRPAHPWCRHTTTVNAIVHPPQWSIMSTPETHQPPSSRFPFFLVLDARTDNRTHIHSIGPALSAPPQIVTVKHSVKFSVECRAGLPGLTQRFLGISHWFKAYLLDCRGRCRRQHHHPRLQPGLPDYPTPQRQCCWRPPLIGRALRPKRQTHSTARPTPLCTPA